ncbi:hypothetical protein MJO28_012684 [Puccinia striiformis f. sp. tritici]|uniref:Uncharacterized protein n=1 Tax=Puccinia striiformis f. sp. tritici TaxID=168172 RepID=A0ACC0E121_9BASI|nr:hypothetical protein MJO28_012684 [Puccinia striiformis f. sp. tritici]
MREEPQTENQTERGEYLSSKRPSCSSTELTEPLQIPNLQSQKPGHRRRRVMMDTDTLPNDGTLPNPDNSSKRKTVGPKGWDANLNTRRKPTKLSPPEIPPSLDTPSQLPPKKKRQRVSTQAPLNPESDPLLERPARSTDTLAQPTRAPTPQIQDISSNLQTSETHTIPQSQPPASSVGDSTTVSTSCLDSSANPPAKSNQSVWPSTDSFSNITPQEILERFGKSAPNPTPRLKAKATSTPSARRKKKAETPSEQPAVASNPTPSASVPTNIGPETIDHPAPPKDNLASQTTDLAADKNEIVKPIPQSRTKRTLRKQPKQAQEHQSPEKDAPERTADKTTSATPLEQQPADTDLTPQPKKRAGVEKKTPKSASTKKKPSVVVKVSTNANTTPSDDVVDEGSTTTNQADKQSRPVNDPSRETIPIPKSRPRRLTRKQIQDQQSEQALLPPQPEGDANRSILENEPETLAQVDSPAPRPGKRRRIDKPAAQPPANDSPSIPTASQQPPGQVTKAADSTHAKDLQSSREHLLNNDDDPPTQPVESNSTQSAKTRTITPKKTTIKPKKKADVPAKPADSNTDSSQVVGDDVTNGPETMNDRPEKQSQSQSQSNLENEGTKVSEVKQRKKRKSIKEPAELPDQNVDVPANSPIAPLDSSNLSKEGMVELHQPPLKGKDLASTSLPLTGQDLRQATNSGTAEQLDQNGGVPATATVAPSGPSNFPKAGNVALQPPSHHLRMDPPLVPLPLTGKNLRQATNAQTQFNFTNKNPRNYQRASSHVSRAATDQDGDSIYRSDKQAENEGGGQDSLNVPGKTTFATKKEKMKAKAKQKKLQKRQSFHNGSVSTTQEVKCYSSVSNSPHPMLRDFPVPSRQSTPMSMINVPKHFGRWELSIPSDTDVPVALLARMHQFLDEAVCAGFAKPIFREPSSAITRASPSNLTSSVKPLQQLTKLSTLEDAAHFTEDSSHTNPAVLLQTMSPFRTNTDTDGSPMMMREHRPKRASSISSSFLSEDINNTVMMTLGLEQNSQCDFQTYSNNQQTPKDLGAVSHQELIDPPCSSSKHQPSSNKKGGGKQNGGDTIMSHAIEATDEPVTSSNTTSSPFRQMQNLPTSTIVPVQSAIKAHRGSPPPSTLPTKRNASVRTRRQVQDSDSSSDDDESEVPDDHRPSTQLVKDPPRQSLSARRTTSDDLEQSHAGEEEGLMQNGPNSSSTPAFADHTTMPIDVLGNDSTEQQEVDLDHSDKAQFNKGSTISTSSVPQQEPRPSTPLISNKFAASNVNHSGPLSEDESDSSDEDSAPPSAQRPTKATSEESSSSEDESSSTSSSQHRSPVKPALSQSTSSVNLGPHGMAGLYGKSSVTARRKTLDAFRPIDFTSNISKPITPSLLSTHPTHDSNHSDEESSSSSSSSEDDDDDSSNEKFTKKKTNHQISLPAHKIAGSNLVSSSSSSQPISSTTTNLTRNNTANSIGAVESKKNNARRRKSIAQIFAKEEARINTKNKNKS